MLSRLTPRVSLLLSVATLIAGVSAYLVIGASQSALADFSNNTTCWGKIEAGVPDPDDPAAVPVKYTIQCDGKITGYSLATAPERQVLGAETEVFVTNGAGDVVGSDSFSCNGTFPGYGVNCVAPAGGDYKTPGNIISGQFFVNRDHCKAPRLDPILTVAYASVSSGRAVQALAGPFDLGHGVDCAKPTAKEFKSRKWAKRKMPAEQDTVLTGEEEARR